MVLYWFFGTAKAASHERARQSRERGRRPASVSRRAWLQHFGALGGGLPYGLPLGLLFGTRQANPQAGNARRQGPSTQANDFIGSYKFAGNFYNV